MMKLVFPVAAAQWTSSMLSGQSVPSAIITVPKVRLVTPRWGLNV